MFAFVCNLLHAVSDGSFTTDQQKDIQPHTNNTPPTGVTIPSEVNPVSAIIYKLPLNAMTPAQNKPAVRFIPLPAGNNPHAIIAIA